MEQSLDESIMKCDTDTHNGILFSCKKWHLQKKMNWKLECYIK